MHALFGAVLIIVGGLFLIAYAVPMIAITLTSWAIGKRAKLDTDDKVSVFLWFYCSVWFVIPFAVAQDEGIIGFIGGAVLGIFWPVAVFIRTYDAVTFSNTINVSAAQQLWMLYAFGLTVAFLRAIYLVNKRAKAETDQ